EAAVLEPHPGLVGWWRLDEGTGSVAGDSSGNGNNGTVYGATWADGKYGKALSFDGVNDYAQVPDSASMRDAGNNKRTLEFWAKFTSLSATGNILMIGLWDAVGNGFLIYGNTVNFWTAFRTATDARDYAANITFAEVLNDWHHFAIVYDGSYVYIYLDGNLRRSEVLTGNWANVPVTFRVNYNPLAFGGIIDEVRIYNQALSAAEVQADFQKSPDFSSKLLAKVPKGTTQILVTLSWQGIGSMNVTMQTPSKSYAEDTMSVYQKTVYSTSDGTSSMLNIKRLSISVTALSSDENWYVMLEFDDVEDYRITAETQK
ncbi:LamG domain-containing protein, partial [Candidatus Bathyarchaeota archaeon]|nr:LamG domain-containing protein [Candidatus Bathyarchaeota archaeon]